MGGGMPKQFMTLGGKPVLAHTIGAFNRAGIVSKIVLTVPDGFVNHAWEIIRANGFDKVLALGVGGDNRAASVYAALKVLPDVECAGRDTVLIHDGVRPFVSEELINAVALAAGTHGAAIAGIPLTDTIKEVDEELKVMSTPDRSRFYSVQTPQGFTYDTVMDAYIQGEADGVLPHATDDSMLVERLGRPVAVVMGDPGNIKITTPEDMALGEILLKGRSRR